jgi:hypothetical protein
VLDSERFPADDEQPDLAELAEYYQHHAQSEPLGPLRDWYLARAEHCEQVLALRLRREESR